MLEGADNFRVRVTVNIRPYRAVAVEVFTPVAVDEDASAAAGNDNRIMILRAPVAHLREWVPQMLFVRLLQLAATHGAPAYVRGIEAQAGRKDLCKRGRLVP